MAYFKRGARGLLRTWHSFARTAKKTLLEKNAAYEPRGVMLLLDQRNIWVSMFQLNAEFPGTELIEAARKRGILRRSLAFIPPHISEADQINLRRGAANDGSDGYRIVSCPPVKDGGGDSVDKTLDEWVQDSLDHPKIDIFIIVSGDKDFGDTMGKIANHGKTAVVYRVDPRAKQLVSNDGDSIPLTIKDNGSKPGWPAVGTTATIFKTILNDLLNQGKPTVPESDPSWKILKALVAGLQDRHWASDGRYQKNFHALLKIAWQDLFQEHGRTSNEQEFKDALTALCEHGILLKHSQNKYPRIYYVFDPSNPLLMYFVPDVACNPVK